ncbi:MULTISPECIES: DUF3566 domain-containing protein [Streptomyces]|uniref:DUF3566 domain-containing protein n=1 Tax=Streptomyces TaxID=1883 RepID=UPI0009392AD6|nr:MULTISPECIES: DUF3566 domain-containing protein [Streptomyces]PJN19156.1 hypothetical protein CG724_10350 [Streptomyces sp. CB02120-2]WBY21089.1 DUF3566 domain-containing protein [Streptomyces goshikiensis]WSR99879.1 DUF3566 domain-containing protein [Streptomyces goshikiensis]WSX99115.1 DUF3566 domain-containing protein [Streptomyces goshikiensis]GHD66944.1 hypothetical protein GCM10010336_29040 [Streptomyces goshikiensis]
MSGATGAGPAKTGADGARGPAADSQGGDTTAEGRGTTVTDTRGPQSQSKSKNGSKAGAGKGSGTGTAAGAAGSGAAAGKEQGGGAQPYQPSQAHTAPSGPGAPRGGSEAAAAAAAQKKARTAVRTAPRTRKARLRVAKADPWSVMKVSFLLSIALGVCTIVASAVLWMVMDAMGVFSTVGGTISEATGSNEGNGFDLQSFLSLPRVLIFTSVIAVIDVVLATALATLGAFIYNLSAGFVGGVELTLAEDE